MKTPLNPNQPTIIVVWKLPVILHVY